MNDTDAGQPVQRHTISVLNDDLLSLIISCLTSQQKLIVMPTCKRWARLVRDLQTYLGLDEPSTIAEQEQGCLGRTLLAALAVRAGRITTVESFCSSPADVEWQSFVVGCLRPHLRTLYLQQSLEPKEQGLILPWLAGLPKLQDLTVRDTRDTRVLASASMATSLTRLAIIWGAVPNLTTPASQSLAGMTRLQTLYLRALAMDPPLLDSLPRTLSDLALPCAYLSNGGLSSALQRLTGLTSLCLAWCFSLTEGDMLGVPLASMTRLRVLLLDGCGLEELPKQLPALTSLQVLSLRDNRLEHLKAEGAFLWRLQALDVSQNPLWIGASALLQQAPAMQLLVYTEAQQYVARSVSTAGTRLQPAVAVNINLSGGTGSYFFRQLVRDSPSLLRLWKLLRSEAEHW